MPLTWPRPSAWRICCSRRQQRVALLLYGNLVLAGFNLLPAFPMDGGRILRALLSYIRPEDEATRLAAWLGRMLAISIALYGLLSPQFMLVFFAMFIYLGAAQEGAAAMGRTLTHGIPVRAAMITEFHTLDHGNTVRDAANLLLSTSQQDFPVMHGDQVVGMLGRNLLMKALANQGPDAYVAGVMDRDFLALEPNRGPGRGPTADGAGRPLRAGDGSQRAAGPAHHRQSLGIPAASPLRHGTRRLNARLYSKFVATL